MLDKLISKKADALIGIKEHESVSDYGVVKFDQDSKFIDVTEKPKSFTWINAGIYSFSPSVIDLLDDSPKDIPDLIKDLQEAGKNIIWRVNK